MFEDQNLLSQNLSSCEGAGVSYDEADDERLLLKAANGDQAAFGVFYRRWLPVVTGYHLRRTRSPELAFDLTAETFAAVVADLQRFDPARGSPAGWLFEIAEHKLLDSAPASQGGELRSHAPGSRAAGA